MTTFFRTRLNGKLVASPANSSPVIDAPPLIARIAHVGRVFECLRIVGALHASRIVVCARLCVALRAVNVNSAQRRCCAPSALLRPLRCALRARACALRCVAAATAVVERERLGGTWRKNPNGCIGHSNVRFYFG